MRAATKEVFNMQGQSDATGFAFGKMGDPTAEATYAFDPSAINENEPKKPEGMDFQDGITADAGLGFLMGGLGLPMTPAMNVATQTAFSADDAMTEAHYYKTLREQMAAEAVVVKMPANDFKPSMESTAFSGKSKTNQGFQTQAPAGNRPSDSDGIRRVVDMSLSAKALGMQMSAPRLG